MYTDRPFDRYLWQFSAWSPQTVTRCHSVRSWRCPDLSLNTSVVAMRRLQSGRLDGVYFSSGSAPRFPTRMTLFTLPMAALLLAPFASGVRTHRKRTDSVVRDDPLCRL